MNENELRASIMEQAIENNLPLDDDATDEAIARAIKDSIHYGYEVDLMEEYDEVLEEMEDDEDDIDYEYFGMSMEEKMAEVGMSWRDFF